MAGYVGRVHINEQESLVGSTLYGICNSSAAATAKTVLPADLTGANINNTTDYINNHFNGLMKGVTIHVKFIQGNTATNNVTLQVGQITTAQQVLGNFTCAAGAVISFTLDENDKWNVNDNVDNDTTYTFATGASNGTISVTPLGGQAQEVSVHGLQDSAYKGVVTGLTPTTTSTDLPTADAVVRYVQEATGGLSGLTGAMHFRGEVSSLPNETTSFNDYLSGDVVLGPNNKEYVYKKGNTAAESSWIELGDEGSYVLASSQSTSSAIQTITLNSGAFPELNMSQKSVMTGATLTPGTVDAVGITTYSIPNVTNAGSPASAEVVGGVLNITLGSAPTIAATPITVYGVDTNSIQKIPTLTPQTENISLATGLVNGTLPSLNTPSSITVVVPAPNP